MGQNKYVSYKNPSVASSLKELLLLHHTAAASKDQLTNFRLFHTQTASVILRVYKFLQHHS